ncbi:hypothetical protein PSHT_09739 [Puccinia striiformis]|uniref:FAR1 domain-containing protein n=1 Tax=Puccinia striiformis TaxID=27350 RepID=A0A2S4VEN0_9BASI|nr:hypothetical protein PSHT_09739 [Puccinia striiformis]
MQKTPGGKNEDRETKAEAEESEDKATIANAENVKPKELNKNGEHEDQEIRFDIPPPPVNSYPTKEACYKSIQDWSLNNGYAIVTQNSYKVQDEARVLYQCDKSGTYRPHRKAPAKEETEAENPIVGNPKPSKPHVIKSRKTNCPFRLSVTYNAKTSMWDLFITNPEHNHPPSSNPSAHLVHRRLTTSQTIEIDKMATAWVMPLRIQNALLKDNSSPFHAPLKTIHNRNYKQRKAALQGENGKRAS